MNAKEIAEEKISYKSTPFNKRTQKLAQAYLDLLAKQRPATNKLYHAVNLMLGELGAKGRITTDNKFVTKVMDVLHDIDGGVYQEGQVKDD